MDGTLQLSVVGPAEEEVLERGEASGGLRQFLLGDCPFASAISALIRGRIQMDGAISQSHRCAVWARLGTSLATLHLNIK